MRQALSDLLVVELAGDDTGSAHTGKLFADLGAVVVKVEPPEGAPLRHRTAGRATGNLTKVSGTHLHLDTNKRSVIFDPTSSEANGQLKALCARADLVIESSGTGSLSTLGLSVEDLRTEAPSLVVVSLSGFGTNGPYADYAWSDIVAQAFAGLVMQHDGRPLKLPAELGARIAGSAAAAGALAAIRLAEHTGEGSHVDCAAYEVLASTPNRATGLLSFFYRGGQPSPVAEAFRSGRSLASGIFPCADGWVSLYTTPQRVDRMLATLDDEGLREVFRDPNVWTKRETAEAVDAVLYPWLLERTQREVLEAAQSHGWSSAVLNDLVGVMNSDHLYQRGFWSHVDHPEGGSLKLPGPSFRLTEGGWSLRSLPPALGADDPVSIAEALADRPTRPSIPTPARHLPLEGIRVIDLTTVWAGPFTTMLLADLGAEVIRVENPWVFPTSTKGMQPRPSTSDIGVLGVLQAGYGPPVEGRPDRPYNRHSMNNSVTRNKLSVSMDIRRSEGHALLMELIKASDVLVENFKPTSLPDLGIHPSALLSANPGLIVLRMPATGLNGDWSSWMGFGPQFDALSGMLWLCGHRDSEPMDRPASTTYMDAASGPTAAFATLAALRYREHTGRGQIIEFAQIENVINHLGEALVDLQLGGESPGPMGNRDPWRAPQGIYPCADGRYLAVSVGDDSQWRRLCQMLGREDLVARAPHLADRQAIHDELDEVLGEWLRRFDADDLFHRLQAGKIPAAPMMDDAHLVLDPQVVAREWLRPLESLDVGVHLHPGHIFSGVPQSWDRGSPVLGQDNEYVYRELLGVIESDYDAYRRSQLLSDDYLDAQGLPL